MILPQVPENRVPDQQLIPASYLTLADALFQRSLQEESLSTSAGHLPPLHRQLLDDLVYRAQQVGLTQPRHGWAIMAVADMAARQTTDIFLQALAAWHLAHAANVWVQPHRVETAVARAREGFAQSGATGWLAACDWQLNAIPWVCSNFNDVASQLEQSLAALEATSMDDLIPDCRQSLAFAYLLVGRFSDAAKQVDAAECIFKNRGNQLGMARCLYIRASYQRRGSDLQKAVVNTQTALAIFQELGALVDAAIAQYGLAQVMRLLDGDLTAAEALFLQAARQFVSCDLPLWEGQCYGGVAQAYSYAGQLAKARSALQRAREIYAHYQIPGLHADNLLDSGQHELFSGNYTASLNYFQHAQSLYEKVGNRWLPVVSLMNQGQVYFQQGRYHQALHYLEEAYAHFQKLKIAYRLAGCEWRLAHVWLQLGKLDQANAYLDLAVAHYQQAEQLDTLPRVYNLRAEILLNQHQEDDALALLQDALVLAEKQQAHAQVALSHRLLGEAFIAVNKLETAVPHLQAAETGFVKAGMTIEQAACQLSWGAYYTQLHDQQLATRSWEQVLDLVQGTVPEIVWQAHANLANLAVENSHQETALTQYRLAVAALSRLRRSLWQPALAGAYLTRPIGVFDRAIMYAVEAESNLDVLHFIEESKAQTVAQRLAEVEWVQSTTSDELEELVADIRWLQKKLQEVAKPGISAMSHAGELQQQFVQKVRVYDTVVSRLERSSTSDPTTTPFAIQFDLDQFRRRACYQLGDQWLALDYYKTDTHIYCFIITPKEYSIWHSELSNQIAFALDMCTRNRKNYFLNRRDLETIGNALLPMPICQQLTPDTHLIIAPHRELHRLPWAVLFVDTPHIPLMSTCIPTIVPSLQSLVYLWQRSTRSEVRSQTGLLLAISDFQGRHSSLPAVRHEAQELMQLLGIHGQKLMEDEATLSGLRELKRSSTLATANFLHIATHAFSDQVTGRLSRIALYDQDVWLDELQSLVPLPPLVTLSACSGIRGLIYEGDEQMGIAIACLTAGAQSVVGSLRSVLDAVAPQLMYSFYTHILAGKKAATALALAQRAAWQTGIEITQWGNFQCIGQPG